MLVAIAYASSRGRWRRGSSDTFYVPLCINGSIRDLPLFNHFGNSLTVRLLVRLLRLEYLLTWIKQLHVIRCRVNDSGYCIIIGRQGKGVDEPVFNYMPSVADSQWNTPRCHSSYRPNVWFNVGRPCNLRVTRMTRWLGGRLRLGELSINRVNPICCYTCN